MRYPEGWLRTRSNPAPAPSSTPSLTPLQNRPRHRPGTASSIADPVVSAHISKNLHVLGVGVGFAEDAVDFAGAAHGGEVAFGCAGVEAACGGCGFEFGDESDL